jgi:hypothetical protein
MRWFVGSAVALLLLWAAFLASPYLALLDLAGAVEARNTERVSARVNVRAFRLSLAKQVAAAGMGSRALSSALGSPDATLAASAAAAAADPLLERIVTPEGVLTLLQHLGTDRTRPVQLAGRLRPNAEGLSMAADLVARSRWRGFRNVYFAVAAEPGGPEARLQLRLSRFRWRLVALELTPEARARLADEVVRLAGERGRR